MRIFWLPALVILSSVIPVSLASGFSAYIISWYDIKRPGVESGGFGTEANQLGRELEFADITDHFANNQEPGLLNPLWEPSLGTNVSRISRISQEENVFQQYSKRQAWNSNETVIDLENRFLDASSFENKGRVRLSTERVWSNHQPQIMLGLREYRGKRIQFGRQDLHIGYFLPVYRFDDYEKCTIGNGEGNISDDDRYILLTCEKSSGATDAISLDITLNQIIGIHRLERDMNWAGFSKSGNFVLIEYNNGSQESRKIEVYDKYLSFQRQLTRNVEHGDFAYDSAGNEVYVMTDWQHVYYYRLDNGMRASLQMTNNHTPGFGHLSCASTRTPDVCYYSSTDNDLIGNFHIPAIANEQQNLSIDITGEPAYVLQSRATVWGHARSSSNTYRAEPKASVNRSGTKMAFESDWYGRSGVSGYIISINDQ